MKKLLITTLIILGAFSVLGAASANDDVISGSYTGWAHDVMSAAADRQAFVPPPRNDKGPEPMKKFLMMSLIVAASLASINMASASMYSGNYTGWADQVFSSAGEDQSLNQQVLFPP